MDRQSPFVRIRNIDDFPVPDPILGGYSRPPKRDWIASVLLNAFLGLVALTALALALAALAAAIWIAVEVIWPLLTMDLIAPTAAQVQAPGFSLERAMAEAAP